MPVDLAAELPLGDTIWVSACKVVSSPGRLKIQEPPRTHAMKLLHFLPYSMELKLALKIHHPLCRSSPARWSMEIYCRAGFSSSGSIRVAPGLSDQFSKAELVYPVQPSPARTLRQIFLIDSRWVCGQFPQIKTWPDNIVGSSKHVFQLGVLSLEWGGTRELVHPEEQWVLCVEEDVLQASTLITWARVKATVWARGI